VLTTKTISDAFPYLGLAKANLSETYLTEMPTDWKPRAHARKWFFADWCKREALPSNCDGISKTQTADRLEEWKVHRQTYLDTLKRPNLRNRDLRGALLSQTFLVGIDLRDAQLEGVDLSGAQLRGAALRGAQLEGADLSYARLKKADLSRAQLGGGVLEKNTAR
jgi:uncharacterized protein YjbI with pentapeptide repeats